MTMPITRILNSIRSRLRKQYGRFQDRLRTRDVPISHFLMGDENGIPASTWARIVEETLRPSIRVVDGPQTELLTKYQQIGDKVFEPEVFSQLQYFKNAQQSIDIIGFYFEAKQECDIVSVARRVIDTFQGHSNHAWQRGQSSSQDPIRVRPIRFSSFYQVIDGHHRLAMAHARGERIAKVVVSDDAVLTPLQDLLLTVLWLNRRKELYQPIDSPELAESWTLVRKCSDRFEKIHGFLQAKGWLPPNLATYVDLGSSYGWFVHQMWKLGFDSHGVERDPIAASVGPIVYQTPKDCIIRSDITRFLRETSERFDVVSFFSVLHHFAMGAGHMSAEEVIKLADKLTGRILFFDTGQAHEIWHREKLPDWTADFVEQWLREHTTFRVIEKLGPDEDAVPPFAQSYGRMLFACYR